MEKIPYFHLVRCYRSVINISIQDFCPQTILEGTYGGIFPSLGDKLFSNREETIKKLGPTSRMTSRPKFLARSYTKQGLVNTVAVTDF